MESDVVFNFDVKVCCGFFMASNVKIYEHYNKYQTALYQDAGEPVAETRST